jgi:hypothetical protein
MRKFILYLAIIAGFIVACEKQDEMLKGNAEIIGFNPYKCGCCWGWIIKIGNDTIKSDDVIVLDTFGYEINKSIPVYIEVGKKEKDCNAFIGSNQTKDYYEIKVIKKLE